MKKVKESFAKKERYYDFSEKNSLFEPELILDRIFDYLGVKSKELDKFKELENEIVHFKKIRFSDGENIEKILDKINQVKNYPQKAKKLQQLKLDFEQDKDLDKYTSGVQQIEKVYVKENDYEYKSKKIKIKYLANHYYIPVLVSESEKIDYLNHIINVPSEVKFIEELEEYLAKPDNVFSQFDWWMFSKLDQTLDEVFIPYFNYKENRIADFKPDFIFWLKPKNSERYIILFVDPKAPTYADANYKIDGYKRIFEKDGKTIEFPQGILVKLLMWGQRNTGEEYRNYWANNFADFADKIS